MARHVRLIPRSPRLNSIQFRRITMTRFTFRAAALAVLALGAASAAAFAADSDARPGGHYEWQQVPQVGP
jgi:hypothetical protein